MEIDRKTKAWIIGDDGPQQTTIEQLVNDNSLICRDEVTTPKGLTPRFHLRNEVELWHWDCCGNTRRKVCEYETKEEAEESIWEGWIETLLEHEQITCIFLSEEECAAFIAEAD